MRDSWDKPPIYRGWYPVLIVGLAMVGFITIKTGRDAIYFGESGRLEDLPIAFVWIGLSSVPVAMAHLWLMNRLGVRRTRIAILAGAALLFIGIAPMIDPTDRLWVNLLFVGVPVVFAAIFATSWLLAGDLLEDADEEARTTVYTRIGAASTQGGIIGGALARLLSERLSASDLIAVGGVSLAFCAVLAARAHRHFPAIGPVETATDSTDLPLEQGPSLESRLMRLLVTISMTAAAAGLLIEFQFYAFATQTGSANPAFFASFYLVLSTVSFLIQLGIAPRIQKAIGVSGALLILPIALVGAAGIVFVGVGAAGRLSLRVTEGGVKSSIHRSAWEQAFLSVPLERRARAKTIVDAGAARVAEGIVAAGLYFSLRAMPLEEGGQALVLGGIVLTLLLWVVSAWRMKSVTQSLQNQPPFDSAVRLDDACAMASAMGANKKR
jgi:hypothetical protein